MYPKAVNKKVIEIKVYLLKLINKFISQITIILFVLTFGICDSKDLIGNKTV